VNITEVKIILRTREEGKLRAYATITFDDAFVVRDLKVIEGNKGLFVAMPSRKLRQPCPHCKHRNAARSKFCNQCGDNIESLMRETAPSAPGARVDDQHRDIAHPITPEAREYIQSKVLDAYQQKKGSDQAPPQAPEPASAQAPEAPQPEPTILPAPDTPANP